MDKTLQGVEARALIHLLCSLEYTGWTYKGSYSQFQREINDYIAKYKRKVRQRGAKFTVEEDKKILKSKNLPELADRLGMRFDVILNRRKALIRMEQEKGVIFLDS
ncbi:MAG TPA: hypothetical protein DD738_02980 [Ruminiclostridium sp.]|nr:hypothetical protein [Ruminiclostridium sp.]